MGAAKENRDRKHFREMFDIETKERQPNADRTALIESQGRQIERLRLQLAERQAELQEAQTALRLEMEAHEKTRQCAAYDAQSAFQTITDQRREYSELSQAFFAKRALTSYEAMLLPCDDGRFVLVHPGCGGLGSFGSIDEAREWATRHDGYIPRKSDHHSFHGRYWRVGFNIWPR